LALFGSTFLGYGSSAVVYNAYYKPLNRRVAIKVIDLDMFERNQIDELRRETQVMALCKHPNVLRVNGAFVTDSKLYIVTPYLSAGEFMLQKIKGVWGLLFFFFFFFFFYLLCVAVLALKRETRAWHMVEHCSYRTRSPA
jgi:serine/threonine protein kinase